MSDDGDLWDVFSAIEERRWTKVGRRMEKVIAKETAYMANPDHRTIKVFTVGQTDSTAYFERSGALQQDKLVHNPFLVFRQPEEMSIRVELVHNAKALLTYPDETPVMAQWPGNTRTDYFRFVVGDLRAWLEETDRVLWGIDGNPSDL